MKHPRQGLEGHCTIVLQSTLSLITYSAAPTLSNAFSLPVWCSANETIFYLFVPKACANSCRAGLSMKPTESGCFRLPSLSTYLPWLLSTSLIGKGGGREEEEGEERVELEHGALLLPLIVWVGRNPAWTVLVPFLEVWLSWLLFSWANSCKKMYILLHLSLRCNKICIFLQEFALEKRSQLGGQVKFCVGQDKMTADWPGGGGQIQCSFQRLFCVMHLKIAWSYLCLNKLVWYSGLEGALTRTVGIPRWCILSRLVFLPAWPTSQGGCERDGE